MRLVALAFLASTTGLAAQAQVEDPLRSWPWEAPSLRVLDMSDGLSNNSVAAVLQDGRGFLWFGTQDGLNRYDGHDFRIYRQTFGDSTSLVDDYVQALAEGEDGALWIGTERGGLARLNPETETFLHYPLDELGPWRPGGVPATDGRVSEGRSVWAIVADGAGGLVLGTDAGAATFDPSGRGLTPLSVGETGGVRALLRSGDHLWVGHLSGDVVRYERGTEGWSEDRRTMVGPGVFALAIDSTGALWVGGSDPALVRLDAETLRGVEDGWIPEGLGLTRHISVAEDGWVWVGSTLGLTVLHPGTGRVERLQFDADDARGLPDVEVRQVLRDRSGNWWFGTWAGLAVLPRLHRAFARIPTDRLIPGGLSEGVVSMATAGPGRLWVGTMRGGLDLLDLESGGIQRFPPDPSDVRSPAGSMIFGLQAVSPDELWLATYGSGIERLREGLFERYELEGLRGGPPELNAPSVFVDSSSRVYAGTQGAGLQELQPGTRRFRPVGGPRGPFDLGSDWIVPIMESDDGALWVGAVGGGLNRISVDRQSVRRWTTDEGLSNDRTLTLFQDRRGMIWIGTEGGGLNRFDPVREEFAVYTTEQGLPHDNVQGILEDARGLLWVSTNDGLARFDPEAEEFWVFRQAAGLAGDRSYADATYASPDGLLMFGGPDGITVVDPSRVERADVSSPVVLTGLTVNQREMPLSRARRSDGLRLAYEERFFTLSFSVLDYTDPSRNRYQYRLDPLQVEWVEAGAGNVATYTSVPADGYTFMVRARNSEGIWSDPGLGIPVLVETPWWQTWWFRMSMVATAALLISALYSYRLQQIKSRQELRLQIAGGLHDDIGGNLSAMKLKADLAGRESDASKRAKYLADISRLARDSTHKVRETVWVVNARYDTVAAIVSQLQDTLDLLLGGKVAIGFQAPPSLPKSPVGMELRQDVSLLFKECLQNISKHSEATRVDVHVKYSHPTLVLVVSDDGCGFDTDNPARGNGLQLMKGRAEKHGGRLSFSSRPGEGTRVELRIRLR